MFRQNIANLTSVRRVLITGSNGQIGSELGRYIVDKLGSSNVLFSDVTKSEHPLPSGTKFELLDVTKKDDFESIAKDFKADCLLHLPALMSVKGEAQPQKAIDVNVKGACNALEVCRDQKLLCFIPSSMAVFNKDAGQTLTKDDTILNPTTVYGISKVFAEQLGAYYHRKFNVDFRCLRYPGIISPGVMPGGGTTDYAVHMFYAALKGQSYCCPVNENEALPMLYVDDAIKGTVDFLFTPRHKLSRCVYNVTGFSFTPRQLQSEINKTYPLSLTYKSGTVQQSIAESWPDSMDDHNARNDFGWSPKVTLDKMANIMIKEIAKQ